MPGLTDRARLIAALPRRRLVATWSGTCSATDIDDGTAILVAQNASPIARLAEGGKALPETSAYGSRVRYRPCIRM